MAFHLIHLIISESGLNSCFFVFVYDVLGIRNSYVNLAFQTFQFNILTSDTLNLHANNICTQIMSFFLILFITA
jgi:hypothetical protein